MISANVYLETIVFMLINVELMVSPISAAKILFIPKNMNSHLIYFSRLAADLAKLGHVTRVLAPSNARMPQFVAAEVEHGGNFSYTTYPMDGDEPFFSSQRYSATLMRVALSQSSWEELFSTISLVNELFVHCEADCARLLYNDDLMHEIRDGGYQFAVMDPVVPHCYYAIPYSLGIPYATFSAAAVTWLYRVPRFPSFYSSPRVGCMHRKSFFQRLNTFIYDNDLLLQLQQQTTSYIERLAPDRPSLNTYQLIQQASLWFYLEDISVGYALPQMPNTVSVGDIMAGQPGKALPRDLEDFMSASENGVMLVSFGSYFDVPVPDVVRKLCDAFTDRRNRLRVIWKTKDTNVCFSHDGRMKLMSWIPQNDLLADPRVHILISHGGFNSIIESVYHAKPLIVLPIIGDQLTNAAAAESKGFAISMDIGDFTSDMLLSNIEKILNDSTYKRNAHLASAILRDRPDTAAQRVSTMINHVIKYGDRHLRTGAFELSTAQFFMFDIFVVLLLACVIVLLMVVAICYCVYLVFRRRCFTPNRSKTE